MASSVFSDADLLGFPSRSCTGSNPVSRSSRQSDVSKRNRVAAPQAEKAEEDVKSGCVSAEHWSRRRKFSPAQVLEIRERRALGEDTSSIARSFFADQTTISLICIGKTYAKYDGPITRRRRYGGTIEERLRGFQIVHDDPDACFGWAGDFNKAGYGTFGFNGKTVQAHRCSLELKLGRRLACDELTRHMCHNPPCTNPRHLLPGSSTDNVNDMVAAGRQAHGEGSASHKLTESDVLAIREAALRGPVDCRVFGDLFGVHATTIGKVLRGRSWRHLLPEEQLVSRPVAPIPGAAP